MTSLIMINGEYSDDSWYQSRAHNFEFVLCGDGGANYARKYNIRPDLILGDMDSITDENLSYFKERNVEILTVPREKDFTDTQLSLYHMQNMGIKDITIWGGIGNRLDHTLANLYSAVDYVKKGIKITFESPSLTIHIIIDRLIIKGDVGDTISVLALSEYAKGVSLDGFKYPLKEVELEAFNPIGISNVLVNNEARVKVAEGVLAVFHNYI
ncbi:MAG: thiamine diphosphokinase [Clostridiales bacterium]|nr:thiamine diphosphokinase [Clostridiales bacterium]